MKFHKSDYTHVTWPFREFEPRIQSVQMSFRRSSHGLLSSTIFLKLSSSYIKYQFLGYIIKSRVCWFIIHKNWYFGSMKIIFQRVDYYLNELETKMEQLFYYNANVTSRKRFLHNPMRSFEVKTRHFQIHKLYFIGFNSYQPQIQIR